MGRVREGRLAVDHLVEDAAQRPDVRGTPNLHGLAVCPVAAAAQDGLGRHVVERAHLALAHDARGVVADGLGDAEVDEPQPALHAQEVGRLEVRVHDALLVHAVHRFQHLLPVQPQVVLVQPLPLLLPLGQQPRQIDLAVLQHHVDDLLSLHHLRVDELDDVLLPLEDLEQFDLVHGVDLARGRYDLKHLAASALAHALELCVAHAMHPHRVLVLHGPLARIIAAGRCYGQRRRPHDVGLSTHACSRALLRLRFNLGLRWLGRALLDEWRVGPLLFMALDRGGADTTGAFTAPACIPLLFGVVHCCCD
eukprot:scaffold1705_cov304-Prasinococcus_capsulatus_cf.AAC.9